MPVNTNFIDIPHTKPMPVPEDLTSLPRQEQRAALEAHLSEKSGTFSEDTISWIVPQDKQIQKQFLDIDHPDIAKLSKIFGYEEGHLETKKRLRDLNILNKKSPLVNATISSDKGVNYIEIVANSHTNQAESDSQIKPLQVIENLPGPVLLRLSKVSGARENAAYIVNLYNENGQKQPGTT